jgi:hypothetical protein
MKARCHIGLRRWWPQAALAAAFCLSLLVTGGCTSANFVAYAPQKAIDPQADGTYKVTGYVFSRDWTTCLLVAFPVGSDLDGLSAAALNRQKFGQVGPVSLHTENYTINPAGVWAHYGGFIPYLVGTRCNYVSAICVRPYESGSQSADDQ